MKVLGIVAAVVVSLAVMLAVGCGHDDVQLDRDDGGEELDATAAEDG